MKMMCMLWLDRFKFVSGLKFKKLVLFLFSFVSDYDKEHETKDNKNQTS